MEVGQTGQCGDHVTIHVGPGSQYVIGNVITQNLLTEGNPVWACMRNFKNVTYSPVQVKDCAYLCLTLSYYLFNCQSVIFSLEHPNISRPSYI